LPSLAAAKALSSSSEARMPLVSAAMPLPFLDVVTEVESTLAKRKARHTPTRKMAREASFTLAVAAILWLVAAVRPGTAAPGAPGCGILLRRGQLRLRGGGGSSLHLAAASGSIYEVEALATGADVDRLDGAGRSALHRAVEAGRLGVAALLVAKGADVDVQDAEERTPLHDAAARGDKGAVIVLLDLGAAVTVTDERGWTPLHDAAASLQVTDGRCGV